MIPLQETGKIYMRSHEYFFLNFHRLDPRVNVFRVDQGEAAQFGVAGDGAQQGAEDRLRRHDLPACLEQLSSGIEVSVHQLTAPQVCTQNDET